MKEREAEGQKKGRKRSKRASCRSLQGGVPQEPSYLRVMRVLRCVVVVVG